MCKVLFLDTELLYERVSAGAYDEALDLVFDFFYAAFSEARFDDVDHVLDVVDVGRLDAHTAYGLLTASYPERQRLRSRPAFLESVRHRLIDLGREGQEVESLLCGLR